MVFLSQYVHERSQILKANIVRTFWGITQIIIWCYLKIIIKKVIANRWITEYFHDLLFPWQPFGWFTHNVRPYQLYTSPYHLAPKYWRKLSLMRQYPRITNFLVFIWSDMLPRKLLPWFFYLSMFFELHHFGKLTVTGTFWAIAHVVIWCYHWIMNKNILTFRICVKCLLFFYSYHGNQTN